MESTESEFVNFYGGNDLIPRNRFLQLMPPGGSDYSYLLYRPARLYICWRNRFLGSLNVHKFWLRWHSLARFAGEWGWRVARELDSRRVKGVKGGDCAPHTPQQAGRKYHHDLMYAKKPPVYVLSRLWLLNQNVFQKGGGRAAPRAISAECTEDEGRFNFSAKSIIFL